MRGSRSSMENADFRRLVAEGRAAQEQRAAAEERPPAPGTLHPDDEDEDALPAVVGGVPDVSFGGGEGAGAKRKGKKKVRKGKPGGGDHDAAAGAHPYRDRAKERRKAEALPEVDPAAAGNAVVIPGITNADLSGITLEQSKFLGGDVEHTHLVKGLDFALLQKVRGGKEEAAAGAAQGMKGAPTGAEFRSDLARAVHRIAVQQPTASPPADKLQPGRTAFVYDLADGLGSLPITVLNPRDGRPDPDLVDARRDKEVLGRISKVMSYLKVGTSGATVKKLRRKKKALDSLQELQAVKAAPVAAEADVDIFADEGGAPGADPTGPNMLLVKSSGGSYFGTSRKVGDGETRADFSHYAELKAGPASGGTAGGAGEDAEALFTDYLKETVERGATEEKERKDVMFGLRLEDDESVYPGGMASYDVNDDDVVGRKVEAGGRGKEGGLSRAQKEKRSEAKLDNQLTKIQEQLEKEGKSHEGAFAAAEPTPKPGKQKKAPSGGQAAGGRQKRLKV